METSLSKKPYKFVPIINSVSRENAIGHNEFNNKTYSGKLDISIKTLSPIHISQGILKVNKGHISKATMRRNGHIVIPGSSFKGMLRSVFEAISESCPPKLPNNFEPLSNALPKDNREQCSSDKMCPTCSVFGMTSREYNYRGKLKISEFILVQDNEKEDLEYINMPNLQSPFKPYPENNDLNIFQREIQQLNKPKDISKRKFGNERLYYADFYPKDEKKYDTLTKAEYYNIIKQKGVNRSIKFRGRKFYLHNTNKQITVTNGQLYEVVKKNKIFKGSITFENLTRKELSILSLALGIGQDYKFKIGYAKPAFYGSIQLNVEKVSDYMEKYKKNSVLNKELLEKLAAEYKENSSSEVEDAIEKLESILKEDNAPSWPEISGNKVY